MAINKERKSKRIKVYVAMSGGVDSSVAAALLKKRGFDVIGVFMKPWSPNLSTTTLKVVRGKIVDNCLWKQDREDAMRVASKLDIPLLTWDFSKEYKKEVGDYMIREYRAGRTPNPDVMCNKEIKFGLFFKKATEEGADFIATGHYVRAKKGKLFVAKDKNKDQSYFLWTLKKNIVEKCLFPIGDYLKPEVRKLAKKFNLSNHAKKDSQGVCFIGPLNMKEFLTKHIKPKKGKIIHMNGQVIGAHDGVYYYTIGQRHGLDIGTGSGPYYVISKDLKKNIIYVGSEKDLLSKEAKVKNISWLKESIKLPGAVSVRLRYRADLKNGILDKNGALTLKSPERAITKGQSAVFYRGSEMLGGGIII
ncbi:MAG: tRNA 2-thiouridine(34) synthase MnmA [Candidatus Paceibacterota bacterium]